MLRPWPTLRPAKRHRYGLAYSRTQPDQLLISEEQQEVLRRYYQQFRKLGKIGITALLYESRAGKAHQVRLLLNTAKKMEHGDAVAPIRVYEAVRYLLPLLREVVDGQPSADRAVRMRPFKIRRQTLGRFFDQQSQTEFIKEPLARRSAAKALHQKVGAKLTLAPKRQDQLISQGSITYATESNLKHADRESMNEYNNVVSIFRKMAERLRTSMEENHAENLKVVEQSKKSIAQAKKVLEQSDRVFRKSSSKLTVE